MKERTCSTGRARASSPRTKSSTRPPAAPEVETRKCEKCKGDFPAKEMLRVKQLEYDVEKRKFLTPYYYYCRECFDEEYFLCSNCGSATPREESHYIESTGEAICNECFDDSYFDCSECGEPVHRDKAVYVKDEPYCPACEAKLFYSCDDCGVYFKKGEGTEFEGGHYCKDCTKNFGTCAFCKKKYPGSSLLCYGEGCDEFVCRTCKGKEEIYSCQSCVHQFKLSDMESVGGRVYCHECAKNFPKCALCGTKNLDSDLYCSGTNCAQRVCIGCIIKEKMAMCPRCANYFLPSGMKRFGKQDLCIDCYDSDIAARSCERFSDCDVDRDYPDLRRNITAVFERSAKNRSRTAIRYFSELKKLLRGVAMDYDTFTYINEHGSTKSMNDLKSPRNALYKAMGSLNANLLVNYVDYIQNNKNDAVKLLRERDQAIEGAYEALKIRMYNEEKHPEIKAATDSIVGSYPAKKSRCTFVITKDPASIIAKTTSQCWESMSCEKVIRGQYGMGAFSDISWSNLVCFVLDEKRLPVARIMVRWCKTEDDEIDFGIEKKWYYCVHDPETTDADFEGLGTSTTTKSYTSLLGGLEVSEATSFLVSILKDKGKYKDYVSCTTPYEYGGYSDTQGKGYTKIRYGRDV